MIRFNRVTVVNFMAISSIVDYEFDAKEIRLLLGRNMDSLAADDNGAGKSSFAEAIKWALYGETTRQSIDKSLTVEHVIREGTKKASVQLHLADDDYFYIITRQRTVSSSTLQVTVTEGTDSTTYKSKEAQAIIEQAMGIDVIQFSNLVYLNGEYPLLFAPSTDKVRKDILSDLVNVAVAHEAQSHVKTQLRDIDVAVNTTERGRDRCDSKIETYTDRMEAAKRDGRAEKNALKELLLQKTKAVEDRDKAKVAWDRATDASHAAAKKKVKKSDAVAKEFDEADAVYQKALDHESQTRMHYLSTEMAEVEERLHSSEQDHALLTKQISKIESLRAQGLCPTCGQETHDVHEDDLEDYQERSKEALDAIQRDRRACEELESKQDAAIDAASLDVEEALAKRNDAAMALKQANTDKEATRLNDEANVLGQAYQSKVSEVNRIEGRIETTRALLTKAKEDFEEAKAGITLETGNRQQFAEEHAALLIQRDNLEFWNKGFGPRGVPSLFIETVLPRISSRIQRYADVLTGGDLQVSLKAYKETKSKTVQEAIQISAINSKGASVYGANSTGERNRINLAVTLGLIEYFKDMGVFHTNLLICDEIFDGLDRTGVQQALHALEDASMEHVVVVSHHEHMKAQFEHVMFMTKEHGEATLAVEGN